MAEAEDVITDAARHATIFARDLWRRHRPAKSGPALLLLADVAPRLDLLIAAVFGRGFPIRAAQSPAPPTVLVRLLQRQRAPRWREAIGATDGQALWLPPTVGDGTSESQAVARFRILALRQAMRAMRGGAALLSSAASPLGRDLYLLFETRAADHALIQMLPGMAGALADLRRDSLAQRPPLKTFPEPMQPLERLARALLEAAPDQPIDPASALNLPNRVPLTPRTSLTPITPLALPATPAQVLAWSQMVCNAWPDPATARLPGPWLWRDQWSGELRAPPPFSGAVAAPASDDDADDDQDKAAPRSARLARRPEVREASDEEDDQHQGAWMVQTAAPQEKAEDPMGLQRPTDRDAETAAEDFADALSELPEARLVSAPGKPKEVLLSDDPPEARAKRAAKAAANSDLHERLNYPEWDWRASAYRDPGATVLLLPAAPGPQAWVDETLAARGAMLHEIRRRFELLRAERVRLHRQREGDEIDLPAFIESRAAFQAGLPLDQRLYISERRGRRDLAVLLLVDVSGSTDGFIAGHQRVIDVEREALLLVCIALEGMNAPHSVQAFSGEGPKNVIVREVKSFAERYDNNVAQRIAGLAPEHYTRAGAALRHATALLMSEPAEHRLLLLLSDGKPNDIDDYEGRYGVEDMRQAVCEARLSGIAPFCLTIDRQAANYLPFVFGPHHYALLPKPELLPTVLLDWLRRLVVA